MNLHEFIILMTLPIGTLGYNEIQMILSIGTLGYNIRHTSEYIPKLQIHQHVLDIWLKTWGYMLKIWTKK